MFECASLTDWKLRDASFADNLQHKRIKFEVMCCAVLRLSASPTSYSTKRYAKECAYSI